MITIEFIVILLCLLTGTRFGGMGLGLISGIGLFILCFVFGLQPGKPPVDVMLTILAVIGCAATLQTAGGLNVMMQFAERLLRKEDVFTDIRGHDFADLARLQQDAEAETVDAAVI